MDIDAYRAEIKLKLTGGVLDLEINDSDIDLVISAALREILRYIDETRLITIPYSTCIHMYDYAKVNSVSAVFRTKGYSITDSGVGNSPADPMYMASWLMLSGTGNLYNISDWAYNFGSYNTSLQIRNTLSTDLAFRFDRDTGFLYINCGFDKPDNITIEFVPRYDDVSLIKSDFWIDKLVLLSSALCKQVIGRVRSRYTQTNALWSQDGERLLQEAESELSALRDELKRDTQLCYPID